MNTIHPLLQLVGLFLRAMWVLTIVYVLGSWVPSLRRASWFRPVRQVVEPLLEPFRRIVPPENLGGLDLSPLFLMLLIGFIQAHLP